MEENPEGEPAEEFAGLTVTGGETYPPHGGQRHPLTLQKAILRQQEQHLFNMARFPCSGHETTQGMAWFPRMLDKLRLHAKGELPPDYDTWLGKGFDGRCCRFLRIEYEALVARTLKGGTDEEILEWCFQVGRRLSNEDIEVWSAFICKRGLRDSPDILADLEDSKIKSGLSHRSDIDTYLRRHDAEEGRAPIG